MQFWKIFHFWKWKIWGNFFTIFSLTGKKIDFFGRIFTYVPCYDKIRFKLTDDMVLLRFVSGILCFGSSLRRTALASWVTLRVMLSEGSWRDLVELDAGIDGLDAVACLDACWPVLLELAAVWVVGLEDVLATFPLSAGLLLKKEKCSDFHY